MSRIVAFPVVVNAEDKEILAFVEEKGLEMQNRIRQILSSKGLQVEVGGPKHDMYPVILGIKNGT